MALICLEQVPNEPKSAALPKMIMHTSEHDIDRFCIPMEKKKWFKKKIKKKQ